MEEEYIGLYWKEDQSTAIDFINLSVGFLKLHLDFLPKNLKFYIPGYDISLEEILDNRATSKLLEIISLEDCFYVEPDGTRVISPSLHSKSERGFRVEFYFENNETLFEINISCGKHSFISNGKEVGSLVNSVTVSPEFAVLFGDIKQYFITVVKYWKPHHAIYSSFEFTDEINEVDHDLKLGIINYFSQKDLVLKSKFKDVIFEDVNELGVILTNLERDINEGKERVRVLGKLGALDWE